MNTEKNEGPRRARIYRIIPQIKTFKKGTLLKNKVDLYYSLEEDIVETGGEDNFSACALPGVAGAGNSFPKSTDFICKETILFFTEATQFRADDGNIYIRAQLLSADKVVWVNILRVPNRVWAFKIRSEQKSIIQDEIKNMFEVLKDSTVHSTK